MPPWLVIFRNRFYQIAHVHLFFSAMAQLPSLNLPRVGVVTYHECKNEKEKLEYIKKFNQYYLSREEYKEIYHSIHREKILIKRIHQRSETSINKFREKEYYIVCAYAFIAGLINLHMFKRWITNPILPEE